MLWRKPDPNPLILVEYDKRLPSRARIRLRLSVPRYALVVLSVMAGVPVTPWLARLFGQIAGF